MKKRYIVFITILVLILLLLSTLFMSFSFGSKESKIDYSHVMRDSITNKSALVTDIAMLGAHDAFSSGINMKSGVNSNESGIQTNKFVGMFAKGLIVRMSKSQIADAKTLLKAGVRYFDMRCTKLDNKYYATHGYLSNEIKEYINDIVDFLGEADGEFIVLDIQHFYTENGANNALDKSEYETLLNYLNEYKNAKGFGILDYVRYDSTTDTLATLTYEKVVGDSSGIIILAKTNELKSCYYRDSNALKDGGNYTSIRSYWHQTNKTKDLLSGMDSEASLVKEKGYDGIFVVN